MKIEKLTVPDYAVSNSDIIFTLDLLTEDDLQTAKKCHDDIQDITQNTDRIIKFNCYTKENFEQVKNTIQDYSQKGFSPLIHIHGHGDKDKGVKISDSNNYIPWDEFIDFFAQIKSQEGNLTVIMSCCFSYRIVDFIYKKYDCSNYLPVTVFYGYENEISAGILENEIKIINDSFFKDGGKSLMENRELKIKCFSEYRYMNYIVSRILSEHEIGKTRDNFVKSVPKKMITLARKYFNERVRNNPYPLIEKLANKIIQNTNDRKKYLDYIHHQIQSQRK